MVDSGEKISKFVRAITQYAEEQRDQIIQEAEADKAERLQKAESEVLSDVYRLIHGEMADMHIESIMELSRRDFAARRKLLERRTEIVNGVFSRAEQQLVEFTRTDAYIDKMISLLRSLDGVLPADGTVFYLSENDKKNLDKIASHCPNGSRLEVSGEIRIGGIIGHNKIIGKIVDCTFESALEQQKEWFAAQSGMVIEESASEKDDGISQIKWE